MKLGIMQPYFLPYLGYFSLIRSVDRWIFFDTPQYIRRGWVNRNRVLKPGEDWQFIKVPVCKAPRETPIREIVVDERADWRDRILRQLEHYRRFAPRYDAVVEFLRGAFDVEQPSLARLNAHLVRCTFEHLELPFEFEMFSDMGLELGEIEGPGDWAFEISRALGASEYVNPPGGRAIFAPEKFRAAGIELRFLEPELSPYAQGQRPFEPGLSIVDVLMFNEPADVREMLEVYEVVSA